MKNHTVLLIDDDVNLQQLVKIALKTKGFIVETANNGLEGLAKLKTVRPDLIILDMNMPKMGGIEFYQKLCGLDSRPIYPVLVLTARANMEQLFKEFNIDGFMAKPFEIDELLKEVEAIIHKKINPSMPARTGGVRDSKKLCIVDDDPAALGQIGAIFLSAGYTVIPAHNGTEGIERIASMEPDVALVKLGLSDISGDIVIFKLRNMAKVQNVIFMLYTVKSAERFDISEKIAAKEGIDHFIEFVSPMDLFGPVDALFKQ